MSFAAKVCLRLHGHIDINQCGSLTNFELSYNVPGVEQKTKEVLSELAEKGIEVEVLSVDLSAAQAKLREREEELVISRRY